MNKREAQTYFRETAPSLDEEAGSWPEAASALEEELRKSSFAPIDLGLDPSAFQELSDQYGVSVEHFSEHLDATAGNFDDDGVPEDGHVRKDAKKNPAGMQIVDPKELFQFNNALRERWEAGEFTSSDKPPEFQEFINNGFDLHSELVRQAKRLVDVLDESYGRMNELYFPKGRELGNVTFRLLRYDGYAIHDETGQQIVLNGDQVAKPHYDRGGMTIQAYSSAPGFWVQPEPKDPKVKRKPSDQIIFPPHGIGQSQVFFGKAHHTIYGANDPIRNLYHGVDRVVDDTTVEDGFMPVRTAAIAFVDSPLGIDFGVTSKETQPDRVDIAESKV